MEIADRGLRVEILVTALCEIFVNECALNLDLRTIFDNLKKKKEHIILVLNDLEVF